MANGKKLIKPGAKRNKKLLTPAISGWRPPEVTTEERITMNPVPPGSLVTVDGDIWLNKTGTPGFAGWKNLSITEVAPAWSAWASFSGLKNPPGGESKRILDSFNVKEIETFAEIGTFNVVFNNKINPYSILLGLTTKVSVGVPNEVFPWVVADDNVGTDGAPFDVVATSTRPDPTSPFFYVVTRPVPVETDFVFIGITGTPISMSGRNLK